MKIKTITCHDVYNVGASLQAYALVEYLRECGHEVEIIDYKPDYLRGHHRLWGGINPAYDKPVLREIYQLLKLPGRLRARFGKRKKAFDHFKTEYLPCTAVRYSSNEDLKKAPPQADVYLAGSDQIWNTLFPNGKDPAFYLDFAPETAVRASYAASFATKNVAEEWKAQVQRWISKLDHVSVREHTGVELCRALGRLDAQQVLDPVFLLDRAHWERMSPPAQFTEPYVLLYDFSCGAEMTAFAKRLAQRNNWKIYSVLPHPVADRCFSQEGPLTFLTLVRDAQFVLSNSFHATAFSIIFERPFRTFDREEGINSRMHDLLQMLQLEHCLGAVEEETSIDFAAVQGILSQEIERSKKYLDMILHN